MINEKEPESAESQGADEAWAERVEDAKSGSVKKANEAWAEPADKDDERDVEDPATKETRREGLN